MISILNNNFACLFLLCDQEKERCLLFTVHDVRIRTRDAASAIHSELREHVPAYCIMTRVMSLYKKMWRKEEEGRVLIKQ